MTKTFPYEHFVEESTKVVWVNYNGNGQLGRYGVPHLIKKFYPGHTYKFCSEQQLQELVHSNLSIVQSSVIITLCVLRVGK